jgi:hypothetical protein
MDANGIVTTNLHFSNSNRLRATVDGLGCRTTFVYDLAGSASPFRTLGST